MLRVRVARVRVSDGTEISVPENGVVLLVGPNNAGKSQFLRDITGWSTNAENYQPKVLLEIDLDKVADEDVEGWVTSNLPRILKDGTFLVRVEGWGEYPPATVANQWAYSGRGLSMLTPIFILHADGKSRLEAGDPQASLDFLTQLPRHPLQRAYIQPEIEDALSAQALAAFGVQVTVDRYGGSKIGLRMGSPPVLQSSNGAPTSDYLSKLKALPPLQEQGDGVRSYLGLLLHMLGATQQIILTDEPEAFLHPPQARQLGRVLADRAEAKQSFIATHSADVLQGVLEADTQTTIVRITRSGNINHAAVLSHLAVKELWSDPLLRYSNLMDGLFHDAVVLCEGDADCRYYAAMLDSLNANDAASAVPRKPELLFTHCGGKARMASVVKALRSARVPVIVVADFDVLKNKDDIERIVVSLGGDFASLESDWKVLSQSLLSDSKPLHRTPLKEQMLKEIDELGSEIISPKDATRLKALLRPDDGWDKAKRSGVHAITQGDATSASARLLEALAELGVLVVPVGELERFAPEVPGHGPAWVAGVLESGLHKTPGVDASSFVAKLRATAARIADLPPPVATGQ